jgi:hypothetical protein
MQVVGHVLEIGRTVGGVAEAEPRPVVGAEQCDLAWTCRQVAMLLPAPASSTTVGLPDPSQYRLSRRVLSIATKSCGAA